MAEHDPRGYLRRKRETHVCGIEEVGPGFYRAWFSRGWEGPLRMFFQTAVRDMDAEQDRRCRQLSCTAARGEQP